MLVTVMNIEALLKELSRQGIFLALVCAPLAGGGWSAELSPIDAMRLSRYASFRITAEGQKLNWALKNLETACEARLATGAVP